MKLYQTFKKLNLDLKHKLMTSCRSDLGLNFFKRLGLDLTKPNSI